MTCACDPSKSCPPTQFTCGDDEDEWCECSGTTGECACVQSTGAAILASLEGFAS